MHHIFIDTNIFLDFYRESQHNYSTNKLNEILNKFIDNLSTYNVYITNHLKDEIFRNRAKVLKEQYDDLSKKLKLIKGFPTIVRSLGTYPQFDIDLKSLERSSQDLKMDFLENSKRRLFEHDNFLNKFFEIYSIYDIQEHEKLAARDRFDFGYPPGKKDSYGDALNWLYLLSNVPPNTNLYLVSRDSDFSNPLDNNEINPYLANEWKDRNGGEIIFLDSIIKLIHTLDEADKTFEQSYISEELDKLVDSGSFSETHIQISKLSKYVDKFDRNQLLKFLHGYYQNPQINWISNDNDVKDFLSLIQNNQHYSIELRTSAREQLDDEIDLTEEPLAT